MAQVLKTKNIVSSTIAITSLVSCLWLIGCGASFHKIICRGSTSTYFATTFRSSAEFSLGIIFFGGDLPIPA